MGLLEHEKKAQQGYDRQAGEYNANRYTTYEGKFFFDLFRAELLKQISRSEPGRILDLATGTGMGAGCFFGGPAKVFGADLSVNMMSVARQAAERAGTRFNLVQSNARLLPFDSNSFRGVLSFRFFHHVPHAHRRPITEEILRVLAPGGVAVLDFKNPYYGLVINKVYDHILKDTQGHYLYPWQVRKLFQDFEVAGVQGIYMPFAQRLTRISPALGKFYLSLGSLWPFKYLCSNLFVIVRKPDRPA